MFCCTVKKAADVIGLLWLNIRKLFSKFAFSLLQSVEKSGIIPKNEYLI